MLLQTNVSPGAASLIWKEFFASRGRGIDWETHLPWAQIGGSGCAGVLCASVVGGFTTVAALLIRNLPGTATAMIGCVCVDPSFRGYGLSGDLIELAAGTLPGAGVAQLVLWTTKPGVYERAGFVVAAQERGVSLELPPMRSDVAVRLAPWPTKAMNPEFKIGLPPYATAGWSATTTSAHLVFVDTPKGPALLDYEGANEAVLKAMAVARPGTWSVTIGSDIPLLREAISRGFCRVDDPGPITMHRALIANAAPPASVPPAFRI
jgi:GNAT superfamily N-acetyltransferase